MLVVAACLSLISFSQAATIWDNLTGKIVTVEYYPTQGHNKPVKETVLENTVQYLFEATNVYLGNNVTNNIIIFPESTLRDDRNSSSEIIIGKDCLECEQPLKSFANIAKLFKSYVVVNLVEKSNCSGSKSPSENCKNYGYNFYNTDVVFHPNGTIINRYRKYNLFGEYDLDRPETAEKVIIKTDFGLKFGIFTCFDIMFKSPAQDILGEDIDGIIFPTMWFSELPFLTAIQTQQMWAHEHNIKFFAAGANNPARGSGGSGYFDGVNGRVLGGYVADNKTESFVFHSINGVPSIPESTETIDKLSKKMDTFYLKRDPSVDKYNTYILNNSLLQNYQLCQNSFCCNFTVQLNNDTTQSSNSYVYRLVAYSGVRSFDGVYNGGIDICGIIACTNYSLSSCGRRYSNYDEVKWPVTFKNITIVADFPASGNRTQFPNSLLSSILPINANETVWKAQNITTNNTVNYVRRVYSTSNQTHLLTFAIYGRNFDLDSPPTKDSSGAMKVTSFLLCVSIFVSLFGVK